MGFSLKRALKKLERATRPIQRIAIGAAMGPVAGVAGSVAKSLGENLVKSKRGRGSKATNAAIARTDGMIGKGAATGGASTAMPGGKKIRLGAPKKAKRRRAKATPSAKAKKPRTGGGGGKRTPPKGGMDLKALSVKWNAAGKPGKWIDFVKANR